MKRISSVLALIVYLPTILVLITGLDGWTHLGDWLRTAFLWCEANTLWIGALTGLGPIGLVVHGLYAMIKKYREKRELRTKTPDSPLAAKLIRLIPSMLKKAGEHGFECLEASYVIPKDKAGYGVITGANIHLSCTDRKRTKPCLVKATIHVWGSSVDVMGQLSEKDQLLIAKEARLHLDREYQKQRIVTALLEKKQIDQWLSLAEPKSNS